MDFAMMPSIDKRPHMSTTMSYSLQQQLLPSRSVKQIQIESLIQRVADSSFPPELRALIMEASIKTHHPSFSFVDSADPLRHPIHAIVFRPNQDLSHLKDHEYAAFTQAANDAFLKTVIFALELAYRYVNKVLELNVPPFLQGKEQHVRHLNLALEVCADRAKICFQNGFFRTIKGMAALKALFPKLKYCTLTVTVRAPSHSPDFSPAIFNTPYEFGYNKFKPIGEELERLLETFAKDGPGKRRSVEMLCDKARGPLVQIEMVIDSKGKDKDKSLGEKLLAAAYRAR